MNAAASHPYPLGHSLSEHQRLSRQGALLAPCTERLLRAAGVNAGMTVLDVGCGAGDVSLLLAQLTGPEGRVVGVDADVAALDVARARASRFGHSNVSFVAGDLHTVDQVGPVDAIVGRLVLMFLPDPAAVLRRLLRCLRPGGLLICQEPSWSAFFGLAANLPHRSACGRWICARLQEFGANPDMGLALHRILGELGLQSRSLLLEVPMVVTADEAGWILELMNTIRQESATADSDFGLGCQFGDMPALLEAEAAQAGICPPQFGLVGAWGRLRLPESPPVENR